MNDLDFNMNFDDFDEEIQKPIKINKESLIEDGNAEIDDYLLKVYKEKNYQVIQKIKEIELPKCKEQIRLVTMKSFNSISFIELIAQKEIIEDMILVIFAINLQAARVLLELFEENKIKKLELIISSVRNAGYSIKSKAVEMLSYQKEIKMMFVNSHAKISTMQTKSGNYYTIEGSGNFSFNGRIEQYIIDNDINIFNFTKNGLMT